MRKIIIVEFISLDGVIQAPGEANEDTSGAFKFGGWLAPYLDQDLGEALTFTYSKPYDLLLGRNTYNIFSNYWPNVKPKNEMEVKFAEEFNSCKKYVATHSPDSLKWHNSESLGTDIVQKLREIKNSNGKNLLVVGSSNLAQTLFAHDLVDEMHLYMAPIILGYGKRLFDEHSTPHSLKMTRSVISKTGMVLVNYERAGEIKTGSMT
jgi:dihydrofolate reductase